MEGFDFLVFLLSLGVGGIAGAIAAVTLTSAGTQEAFAYFRQSFLGYMQGRNDPASQELRADFDDFEETMRAAGSALDRLRRALRRR